MNEQELEALRKAFTDFDKAYQFCRGGIDEYRRKDLDSKIQHLENTWWKYVEQNNLSKETCEQESELGYMFTLCHAKWSYCRAESPDKIKLDALDEAAQRHREKFESVWK